MNASLKACTDAWVLARENNKIVTLALRRNAYAEAPSRENLLRFLDAAAESESGCFSKKAYADTGSITVFLLSLSQHEDALNFVNAAINITTPVLKKDLKRTFQQHLTTLKDAENQSDIEIQEIGASGPCIMTR